MKVPDWRRVVFSSSGDLTRARRAPGYRIVTLLGAAAEDLFATVFPSDCRLCNVPLTRISRAPVCEHCLASIRLLDGCICSVCGERLSSFASQHDSDQPRCLNCQRSNPPFAKAVAYGPYSEGLRELIHLLKYDRIRPVADVLGRMLSETVSAVAPDFEGREVLVIPVPLHSGKFRQRGFNQSELIARSALKRGPVGKLNASVLQRKKATESQTGLTREQRRNNVRGAFAVTDRNKVAGKDILLTDDVLTTGTTVTECTRVLLKAGAARVWVATVARVMVPEPAGVLSQKPFGSEDNEQAPLTVAARA